MIILTIPLYDFCRITTTLPFVGMTPPNAGILVLPFVGMNPPGVQTPLGISVLPFVGMNPSIVKFTMVITISAHVKFTMGIQITIPPNVGITTPKN